MQSFRSTFVAVAAFAVLATAGCDDPLHPCEVEQVLDDSDFLDALWTAQQINGSLIPVAGFKADEKTFVKAVTMDYHTTKVTGGCLKPNSMEGSVIVRFKLVDQVGVPKDSKSYVALFEYNVKPGDIFFRVDTELASGERIAKQVVTVNPVTPSGWTAMTIRFTR